ncbi:MAG: hypothetical protein ACOY3P_09250 [Planctomycetota bacterium]
MQVVVLWVGSLGSVRYRPRCPSGAANIPSGPLLRTFCEKIASLNAKSVTMVMPRGEYDADAAHVRGLLGAFDVVLPDFAPAGPAPAVLLAADSLAPDESLVIVEGGAMPSVDFNRLVDRFRRKEFDAGGLGVRTTAAKRCFLRVDRHGALVESSRHPTASHLTLAGLAYFAKSHCYLESARRAIREDAFDLSVGAVFNRMILCQQRIGIHEIPRRALHHLRGAVDRGSSSEH